MLRTSLDQTKEKELREALDEHLGGILAVAPGKLAIAAFSPPLDEAGNSVRAAAAVAHVAKALNLNLYAPAGADA